MEDLNEVAIFIQVVEKGSFSGAAKQLHVSTSIVSKKVSLLETRLRTRLLNRSTRRLSLTEVGEHYYRRCVRALSEILAADSEAKFQAQSLSGTIRIHANLGVGLRVLASGILDFTERYPELSVDLSVGTEPVNLMEEGVDILIRSVNLSDASLDSRILSPVTYHICAAPSYFERAGMPETPHDLVNHNCLVQTSRRPSNEWQFRGADGPYTLRVSGSFSANSGTALYQAAVRGLGIVHLPSYIVWEALRAGSLVSIFEGQHVSDRTVRAFFPKTRHPMPKLMVFLDFLEHCVRERCTRPPFQSEVFPMPKAKVARLPRRSATSRKRSPKP
ncbi:MAG TPA: LysR family transcriptional regulator [Alphaproteobacteria bacterium]